MNQTSKISPQVCAKFGEFLLKNNFALYEGKDSNGEILIEIIETNEVLNTPIELNNFFSFFSYHQLSKIKDNDKFFILLPHDIKINWSDVEILDLYENNENSHVAYILKRLNLVLRYLTHPITLERVTLQNIDKYCSWIDNRENMPLFIEKLMVHPNWVNKEAQLKDYLVQNGHQFTLNKLFGENKQELVQVSSFESFSFDGQELVQAPSLKSVSYELNMMLISTESLTQLKSSDIHDYLIKSITNFNDFRPSNYDVEGIFCASTNPTNFIRTITFLGHSEEKLKIFAQVFFDIIRATLKKPYYYHLGDDFNKVNIQGVLRGIDSIYTKQVLEASLLHKNYQFNTTKI